MRMTPIERFWSKVDSSGDCWNWTGARNEFGYGLLEVDYRMARAHRLSWELHFGAIPEGLFVCHRCDNPQCVRPDHLFLGTAGDNNRDRKAKGRNATHYNRNQRGERNNCAKLTEVAVLEIRSKYAIGTSSQQRLAEEFGVAQTLISQVVRRKVWGHVA